MMSALWPSCLVHASSARDGAPGILGGRLRDEILDRELFLSLPEARVVLGQWRMHFKFLQSRAMNQGV
jgi:hypothetical protein